MHTKCNLYKSYNVVQSLYIHSFHKNNPKLMDFIVKRLGSVHCRHTLPQTGEHCQKSIPYIRMMVEWLNREPQYPRSHRSANSLTIDCRISSAELVWGGLNKGIQHIIMDHKYSNWGISKLAFSSIQSNRCYVMSKPTLDQDMGGQLLISNGHVTTRLNYIVFMHINDTHIDTQSHTHTWCV